MHAVLRCDDPEITALKPTNAGWTPFFTASYERMMWPDYRDRRVLGDTAFWAGDEVGVVVAAESEHAAHDALRAVKVDWQEHPFVLDMWEALEPGAPILHPDINPESNLLPPQEPVTSPVFLDRGDVDQGFAEADVVAEIETHYHNPDHGCLDTRGCIMQWDGDYLTCWTSFYQADQTRMSLATMLDMPLHRIRVMNPYIGGNFGRGNQGDQPFLVFTALLAKRCNGRPVLYRMSRREDFHDTRTAATYRLKAGAKADGTIVALHSKGYGSSGAYADHTMATIDFVPREFAELTLAPIPNLRMEARAIYTNTVPGGVKRGIGNNEINLAFGQILDDLGEKLGMDPVEIARKNCGHEWGTAPDPSVEAVLREGAAQDRLGAAHGAAHRRPGRRPEEARHGLLDPQHLARRVAGAAARPHTGAHQAEPGLLGGAGRAHGGDGHRLQQLQRVRLRRRPGLPGRHAGRHQLHRRHRHRARPQGPGADRQRRLVRAGRDHAQGRGRAEGQADRHAGRGARGAPRGRSRSATAWPTAATGRTTPVSP